MVDVLKLNLSVLQYSMSTKGITGFPGYYVTNQGVVISVRWAVRNNNRKGGRRAFFPSCRAWGSTGHLKVDLYDAEGKRRSRYIHRLVLETFGPVSPEGKTLCRHLNDVPTDNRIENLAWGDHRDNALDYIRNSKGRNKIKAAINLFWTWVESWNPDFWSSVDLEDRVFPSFNSVQDCWSYWLTFEATSFSSDIPENYNQCTRI